MDQISVLLDYAMTFPWYVTTFGGIFVCYSLFGVLGMLFKTGKALFLTGRTTARVGYAVASSPFRLGNKIVRYFVPQDINTQFLTKASFTVEELVYLNNYMYKHGTSKINSRILTKYIETATKLRDSKGRPVRIIDIPSMFKDMKPTPHREISRPVLELSARGYEYLGDMLEYLNQENLAGSSKTKIPTKVG